MKTRECKVCGKEFVPAAPNATMCSRECREVRRKEEYAKYKKKIRNGEKPAAPSLQKKIKRQARHTVREVLHELENYNEEHGTCVSYGKFVSMMGY